MRVEFLLSNQEAYPIVFIIQIGKTTRKNTVGAKSSEIVTYAYKSGDRMIVSREDTGQVVLSRLL